MIYVNGYFKMGSFSRKWVENRLLLSFSRPRYLWSIVLSSEFRLSWHGLPVAGQQYTIVLAPKMSNLVKLLLLLNVIFVKSQDYLNTPVFNYTFSEGQFQPPILEYFKKNHQKYQRDSPKAWTGSPVQDPILGGLLLGEDVKSGGFIGPRKKRSTISLSTSNEKARQIIRDALNHMLNMPLWCWKIYVNCIKYSNHACCPKRRPRRSKREDVTVVYGVTQRRSDQTWKPYSPYYIGLPGFKKPLGM